MIGQTIAHYRITAKLGQGGMGEVYLATDSKLDREVAIKVLPQHLAESQTALARFKREATTGVRPFARDTAVQTMTAILERNPPELSESGLTMPPALGRVLERCLEKKPDERFQSARDLAFSLGAVLVESEISRSARPAAASRPFKPWWILGALTTMALLLGIFHLLFPREVEAPQWESTPLTTSIGLAEAPSLSPDGNAIVYDHNIAGPQNIYSKNVVDGTPNQLTSTPYDDFAARYSPQGNRVAFLSDRGLGTQVFWIPSLGGVAKHLANTYISGVERIADALVALGSMPWSPDAIST